MIGKLELFILAIIILFIYDSYYGGKLTKLFYQGKNMFKKYYKMISYIFMGSTLYFLIKSKDMRSKNILFHGLNMLQMTPINTKLFNLSPIFDLTKSNASRFNPNAFIPEQNPYNISFMEGLNGAPQGYDAGSSLYNGPQRPTMQKTKRSVSESKKRYVAYSQGWMCASCGNQLNHTFEVDHKHRLEFGGSNDISNLSALCRNCHGLKTSQENMAKSDM